MIIFKILAPTLVLLLSVIQFYIDHKFKDKRTKIYKRIKAFFLVIIGIAIVFTIVTIFIDDSSSKDLNNKIESLQKGIGFLKKQSSQSDSLSITLESNASVERKTLVKQISELQKQINPFIELAVKKYPNLTMNEALEKLTIDFEKLKRQTEIIEQKSKDRSFTETQTTDLVSYLKNYKSNKITITSVWGDQEAFKYASKIKKIFSDAGWAVNGVNQAAYNTPMQGLLISVKGEPVPEIANIVWRAFNAIGMRLPDNRDVAQDANEVTLIIGSKENN